MPLSFYIIYLLCNAMNIMQQEKKEKKNGSKKILYAILCDIKRRLETLLKFNVDM